MQAKQLPLNNFKNIFKFFHNFNEMLSKMNEEAAFSNSCEIKNMSQFLKIPGPVVENFLRV